MLSQELLYIAWPQTITFCCAIDDEKHTVSPGLELSHASERGNDGDVLCLDYDVRATHLDSTVEPLYLLLQITYSSPNSTGQCQS